MLRCTNPQQVASALKHWTRNRNGVFLKQPLSPLSALDSLRKSLIETAATTPECIIQPVGRIPCGSHRWYSSTTILPRKMTEEEKVIAQISEEIPDFQTMNVPDDWTQEDIDKTIEQARQQLKEEEEERWVKNWKPGMRKRPWYVTIKEEDVLDYTDETRPPRWTQLDRRCGMLAIKVGMMPYFDRWGIRHACTILFADQNVVLGHKVLNKHGYIGIQIAAGQRKRKNVKPAILGQYKNLMLETEYEDNNPPKLVREFRLSDEKWLIPINTTIHARHFVPGQNVDVSALSKGKGFQGVMKRHGFKGGRASHGVTKNHRKPGTLGSSMGRVWKGKKLPGHMGHVRVTIQNQRIVKIDRGRNLIYVRGHVPGPRGAFVEIRDAKKAPLWKTDKVQPNADGEIPDRPPLPTFDFDPNIDGSGEAGYEEIMPLEQKDPLVLEEEA